jgi:quercetin dioxygenase-like cupin family protein
MSTRFAVPLVILCVSLPSLVDAQGVPKEVALASTFKDAQLKWGPCPPFIPKGCEIAVLHGDPAKANADVFFKVPGDFTIPDHWHTSAERMVLVSGELRVTYEGQNPITLRPGMYAYGPAKLPHSASCAKGDPCVLLIAFESAVDAFPTDSKAKK